MRGDNNQPLPPELDWENMKDGIFDKIQSMEQMEAYQRKEANSKKRVWFLLFLIFPLGLGLFFISQNMTKGPVTEAKEASKLSEADVNRGQDGAVDFDKLPSTDQSTKQIEFSGKNQGAIPKKSRAKDDLKSGPNHDPKQAERAPMDMDKMSGYGHQNKPGQLNTLQNAGHTAGATPGSLDTALSSISPLEGYKLPGFRSEYPIIQALSTSLFGRISLGGISDSIVGIERIDSMYSPIPHKKPHHQLILEGGLTFWDQGYGNTSPQRAQFEIPISSFQLQGHYMRSFSRNHFVMLGLQYQQLESRFQYSEAIEDYRIVLEDTIIQVRNNLLTGDQNIIRGDVEQSVRAERRVQHYNKSRLFKVSIGLGKSWRFNSFQTDVYLGGALNAWVQNQGRTLSEDAIIDYNGTSNPLFQNQLKADGVLGARLHYFLNSNLGLTAGFQAQKSLMNWSNQGGVNFYPASLGVQIGLSYSL